MGSRLGTGALAGFALNVLRNRNIGFLPAEGLDERDLEVVAQICARPRPGSSSRGRTETKEILEDISKGREDVLKPSKTGEACPFESLDAVPVVDLPFVGVTKNFISL